MFACEQEHIKLSTSPIYKHNVEQIRAILNLDFYLSCPCMSLKVSPRAPMLHVKQFHPQ